MSIDLPSMLQSRSLLLLERILGQADRNPASRTYGCFDRYYWHYRLHDLANARFQEATLFLAKALEYLDSRYRQPVRELIRAGIDFWASSRNSDGSVNEIYPYERSFCATSMSAHATSCAAMLLDIEAAVDWQKTGDWLLANHNPDVTNQMAGAGAALARIGHLTGSVRYLDGAREKVAVIIDKQLPSGCYLEYDGADTGYATITLALLASYHEQTGDARALDSMQRCESYLAGQVRSDGSYDWRHTSRRTQFIYPSGLAYLRSPVLERLRVGLARNVVVNPLWMDDRYSIPLAADYLTAFHYLDCPPSIGV